MHSMSIVIHEEDSGIELHDKILIVLVRELTERYDPKSPKSIIHIRINMSIIPQVLHIDLLVGSKLLRLGHHQLIENTGLKHIAEPWICSKLSGSDIGVLLTKSPVL